MFAVNVQSVTAAVFCGLCDQLFKRKHDSKKHLKKGAAELGLIGVLL